ncbi:hypothetical protein FALBO_8256 [Fusarium albosuccineum]|uniref:Zn(2)-C6 fungal-type domain-containing protein n=1 Tax=Fusarium albosuccineum TaxID=1237068 RepID=A0A8H4L9U4_9HYPO|nr:hypothetical protein FALBO_8256 [Fusarium albosuccineum]
MEATTPPAGIRVRPEKTGLKREHAADAANGPGRLKRHRPNQQRAPWVRENTQEPTPSQSSSSENSPSSPVTQDADTLSLPDESSLLPSLAELSYQLQSHTVFPGQDHAATHDARGLPVDHGWSFGAGNLHSVGSIGEIFPTSPPDHTADSWPQLSLHQDARHGGPYAPVRGLELSPSLGVTGALHLYEQQASGQSNQTLSPPSAFGYRASSAAYRPISGGDAVVVEAAGFPSAPEGKSGGHPAEEPERKEREATPRELSTSEGRGGEAVTEELLPLVEQRDDLFTEGVAREAPAASTNPVALASDPVPLVEVPSLEPQHHGATYIDDDDIYSDSGCSNGGLESDEPHGDGSGAQVDNDSREGLVSSPPEEGAGGRSSYLTGERASFLQSEQELSSGQEDEGRIGYLTKEKGSILQSDEELNSNEDEETASVLSGSDVSFNHYSRSVRRREGGRISHEGAVESHGFSSSGSPSGFVFEDSDDEAFRVFQRLRLSRVENTGSDNDKSSDEESANEAIYEYELDEDDQGLYESDDAEEDDAEEDDTEEDDDEAAESIRRRYGPPSQEATKDKPVRGKSDSKSGSKSKSGPKDGPKPRRNLKPGEREEVKATRKLRACVRCRMQKIKCAPDPEDPEGVCKTCKNYSLESYKTIHFLPCQRFKIADLILYRSGGLNLTRRWQGIAMRDVTDRLDGTVITIQVSQGLCKKPLPMHVVRFKPKAGDVTARYWTDKETFKKKELANYCLQDIVATAEAVEQYTIQNAIPAYFDTVKSSAQSEPKSESINRTYLMALQRYMKLINSERGAEVVKEDEKEAGILHNLFILWCAIRHTTGSFYIDGEEKLGMMPETEDESYPLLGKVSVPRMIVAQFDNLNYVWVLERYKNKLLKDIDWLMSQNLNNPRWWFTTYLIIFILLREASEMSADRYRHARANYGERLRYSIPDFVENLHDSCNNLLTHWHYYNAEGWPSSKDKDPMHLGHLAPEQYVLVMQTLRDPEVKKQLSVWKQFKENNGKGAAHSLGIAAAEADDRSLVEKIDLPETQHVRYKGKQARYDWDHPHYWVAQMFERDWQPHPTYQRETIPKISAATSAVAAAG